MHGGRGPVSPETAAAQALGRVDPETRALIPPIHPSTTYERDADGGYRSGRGYTRPHNPTYDEPEALLKTLEGGRDCMLFASGMAACTAVFQSLLPGDHVVAPRVMYWSLRKWLLDFALPWGLEVDFIDASDPDALAAAVRPGETRLVWVETPANPTWSITDIAAAAEIAHGVHARLVVDNTIATPVLTRPIELGADLVVHSASKYLNGHSDVLAGAIVCAREDSFWHRIRAWRRDAGAMLGPFEAWLLLRGMRTLFVRVARSCESALAIARHFESHPRIAQVLYPGLASHRGHALAASQMRGGFGGMLSLRHREGEAAAIATAAAVRVFKRATSLGGVESLLEHRASVEGPATPVPADLLRLSIGLESAADLIADLEEALERSAGTAAASVSCAPAEATPEPIRAEDAATRRLRKLVERQIRPLVLERGGDLNWSGYANGVLELAYAGSPGAALAARREIRDTVAHYAPEVHDVKLVARRSPSAGEARSAAAPGSLLDRVERTLEEHVNPAVRSHGGRVALVGVDDGTASIRFEGRCQGCAMAEVTLRQGVEVILREQVAGIVGVVDLTDHTAGTDPYFRTRKGTA
ncbi:MAG: PLP-dependent transferase [Burkholderiales bacterium]|nr:PLP-dependent transferase [Burkholderiales bacterium]